MEKRSKAGFDSSSTSSSETASCWPESWINGGYHGFSIGPNLPTGSKPRLGWSPASQRRQRPYCSWEVRHFFESQSPSSQSSWWPTSLWALQMFFRFFSIQMIWSDAADRGALADGLRNTYQCHLEIAESLKSSRFQRVAKGWIAERTVSWFGWYRRFNLDY